MKKALMLVLSILAIGSQAATATFRLNTKSALVLQANQSLPIAYSTAWESPESATVAVSATHDATATTVGLVSTNMAGTVAWSSVRAGVYTLTHTTDGGTLTRSVTVAGNAFGSPLCTWDTDGANGWLFESATDTDVLRSGVIGASTNSWMETTIVGPASFSFDWKVSCNTRGHYLQWLVDGVEQSRIRGEVDWTTVSASIPEGEHVIRFNYVKGSTAASGEDKGQVRNFVIDPVRIETEDMQVLWDWSTNYFVSVITTGYGNADFTTGWVADGTNLVVHLQPSIHSYTVALSGDTNGVVLAGTDLTIPVAGEARSIAVAINEVKPRLTIVSAQGESVPSVGEHEYASDVEVSVSAVAPDPANGVRAVCTGWTGTGSVPAQGTGSSVTFPIYEDSTLTWNWMTGYWVEFSIVGKGQTTFTNAWIAEGTDLVIPFSVTTPFYDLLLSGDTTGVTLGTDSLTVPVTSPRSIVLTVTERTYASALDNPRLEWTSGGASVWVPQSAVSHDGEDAAKSGQVIGEDVSTLTTTTVGTGTLSWWWKLDMTECAGVDVFVDDESVAWLDAVSDWMPESIDITGEGEHVVRFEFWNAGTEANLADCAYLDQVTWSGAVPTVTKTTPVPVPYAWLESYALAGSGDYEAAAFATAANGENAVWECYVAGLDPTNPDSRLLATIRMEGDTPVVGYLPPRPEHTPAEWYHVVGKADLADEEWEELADGQRFFMVKIVIP